jgi:aspartate racemase
MKTAGIIGGLGPDTTAEFYIETIRRTHPVYSYSYPSIFIYNVPVPFAVERAMVQKGQREEEMFKVLSEAVGSLEKAGVNFVVIPCNTVHIFYDRLAGQMNVPLLNILEEMAAVGSTRAWKRAGVLGTRKTRQPKCPQEDEKRGEEVWRRHLSAYITKRDWKILPGSS